MYHHPTLRGGEIASFRSFRWSSWHVTYSFPRLLKMSALFSSLFRRDRECSAWITFGQAGACSHRSKSLSRLIQSEHGLGRSRQIFISQRFCTKRGRGKKNIFPCERNFLNSMHDLIPFRSVGCRTVDAISSTIFQSGPLIWYSASLPQSYGRWIGLEISYELQL